MIDIQIKIVDGKIADKFIEKDITLSEVGAVLLRLKQIEQILVNKEFGNEIID